MRKFSRWTRTLGFGEVTVIIGLVINFLAFVSQLLSIRDTLSYIIGAVCVSVTKVGPSGIPGSRDLQSAKIPGFLKLKSRDVLSLCGQAPPPSLRYCNCSNVIVWISVRPHMWCPSTSLPPPLVASTQPRSMSEAVSNWLLAGGVHSHFFGKNS